MRVLITGAGGFVGGQLATQIASTNTNIEIYGTVFPLDKPKPPHLTSATGLDLKDYDEVLALLDDLQPDAIYHLAAQAFVPRSFEAPWETLENNIRGQLNIIEACLSLGLRPRILIVSSAEIYGAVHPDELPLDESAALRPSNPYSVSKVAQDMMGLQYYLSHELPIMRARAFNHFGPGQNDRFVAPAFALQIARIEAGQRDPILEVGNLEAKRDFTDVRDIVRAYRLIIDKGAPGNAYNIASGNAYSIQYLLDTLLDFTTIPIEVRVNPERLRPVDVPIIQGDASLLKRETGWEPQIPFEQTMKDVLEDSRRRIKAIQKE